MCNEEMYVSDRFSKKKKIQQKLDKITILREYILSKILKYFTLGKLITTPRCCNYDSEGRNKRAGAILGHPGKTLVILYIFFER